MESLLENISYNFEEHTDGSVKIDAQFVNEQLKNNTPKSNDEKWML